jgi:hypothetical protein
MKQLQRIQQQLSDKLSKSAKNATIRAIEKAAEETPPTGADLGGTHTRTGELKQHWAADSHAEPSKRGNRYVSLLANNQEYASYVNDGHRMDRHFVPGLYINPGSGMLEYAPGADVGLVVGTKTAYVPGLFMVDKAKEEYSRVVKAELSDLEELFK